MGRRTIWLLAGAAVVIVLYFGDQGWRRFVDGPARQRERQLSELDQNIKQARDLIARGPEVLEQLEAYARMSLPLDRETTRSNYQNWLLAAVKENGLEGTSVEANLPVSVAIQRRNARTGQPKTKTVLTRYTYSLSCHGSLQQIVQFLYQFYQSGHLHLIRSLSLNPLADGNQVDASMTIEALSLSRTGRETELSEVQVGRLAGDSPEDYFQITRRNIFSRLGDLRLHDVRLTGIAYGKNGEPQAWIQQKPGEPSTLCSNDDILQIGFHTVEVVDIQSISVVLLVDGVAVRVSLGQSLKDAMGLPEVPSGDTTSEVF